MKKDDLSSTALSETTPSSNKPAVKRRSFLKGMGVAGAALSASALLTTKGFAQSSASLTKGDVDILRFLAAAEILETDLWLQYTELGGVQDGEEQGLNGGNKLYTQALQILDGDMAQYIHDNTDDEISHQQFINAYLISKGAEPVDLDAFRNLPSSKATGAKDIGRLTNLMNLTVDTSFWTRYRSATQNPDVDHMAFPQAVTIVNRTAIPRTDDDTVGPAKVAPLHIPDHLKAIAFTAGFHFCAIEQGGSSLYPSLAQRVANVEVLRILLSIGPTETSHFQTWMDKAGNVLTLTDVDPVTGSKVHFRELAGKSSESLQGNLIMPEPCPFLSRKFQPCSIIRPTKTEGVAMGAIQGLTNDGLFIGQSKDFFAAITKLAQAADAAKRGL
jgi:hypothetical protein